MRSRSSSSASNSAGVAATSASPSTSRDSIRCVSSPRRIAPAIRALPLNVCSVRRSLLRVLVGCRDWRRHARSSSPACGKSSVASSRKIGSTCASTSSRTPCSGSASAAQHAGTSDAGSFHARIRGITGVAGRGGTSGGARRGRSGDRRRRRPELGRRAVAVLAECTTCRRRPRRRPQDRRGGRSGTRSARFGRVALAAGRSARRRTFALAASPALQASAEPDACGHRSAGSSRGERLPRVRVARGIFGSAASHRRIRRRRAQIRVVRRAGERGPASRATGRRPSIARASTGSAASGIGAPCSAAEQALLERLGGCATSGKPPVRWMPHSVWLARTIVRRRDALRVECIASNSPSSVARCWSASSTRIRKSDVDTVTSPIGDLVRFRPAPAAGAVFGWPARRRARLREQPPPARRGGAATGSLRRRNARRARRTASNGEITCGEDPRSTTQLGRASSSTSSEAPARLRRVRPRRAAAPAGSGCRRPCGVSADARPAAAPPRPPRSRRAAPSRIAAARARSRAIPSTQARKLRGPRRDHRQHRRRDRAVLLEQPVEDLLDVEGELAQIGEPDHPAAALQRVEAARRTVRSASRAPGLCSRQRAMLGDRCRAPRRLR